MSRPFTDIKAAISANPVKNGSIVMGTTFTGRSTTNSSGKTIYGDYTINYDPRIKSTPTISTIASKYGNRFYNGIFVGKDMTT
jgi:hypothetical protein